ncbi:MAG: type IV toxin-antitoxin system AbiEi family antitoxin domain-containing protein [Microbacterium sp.]
MPDQKSVPRVRAAELFRSCVFTRAELRERGWSSERLTAMVRDGRLLRLRRDRYAFPGLPAEIGEAVRVGGRLSCLTLLRSLGVFVHRCAGTHIHIRPGTSRLRPRSRDTVLHWTESFDAEAPLHVVSLIDAVGQAIRCQEPRAALATLDSLVHHRLLGMDELLVVFSTLPRCFRSLLKLIDSSAESGPETYMRLILRTIGATFETQVQIVGVGRVDFVVDGWLIVECDSREYHAGWDAQVADRRRDLAAARQGYVTVRPLAADIMDRPASVREALRDVIDALSPRRPLRVHNSSESRGSSLKRLTLAT